MGIEEKREDNPYWALLREMQTQEVKAVIPPKQSAKPATRKLRRIKLVPHQSAKWLL